MQTRYSSPTLLKSPVQLPLEILEQIVSLIDLPHELLALALSARIFKDIVIPNHLEFRKIRCKTNSIAIGTNLQKQPFLCMRLRELELIDHRRLSLREPLPMIPKLIMEGQNIQQIWDPYGDYMKPSVSTFSFLKGNRVRRFNYEFWDSSEESLVAMTGAILYMKNLTRIRLSLEDINSPVAYNLLYCIGNSCNSLSHLAFRWGNFATATGISPLWNFKGLKTFSLALTHEPSELTYVDNLIDMLLLWCNDLRDLHLSIRSFGITQMIDLSRLLIQGNWTLMDRFAIDGMVTLQAPVEPLLRYQMFIDRHPSLRCIELERRDADLFFGLKPKSLPHLELLSLDSLSLALLPSGCLEVLQRVQFLIIRQRLEVKSQICLLQGMSRLTTLKISIGVDFLSELWKCLPASLMRLSITVYDGIRERPKEDFLQCFLSNIELVSVTHLCILPFFRSLSVLVDVFRQPETLGRLAVAPNLKFVLFIGAEDHNQWVSLRRDSTGKYLAHQIAPRGTVEDALKWGHSPFDVTITKVTY